MINRIRTRAMRIAITWKITFGWCECYIVSCYVKIDYLQIGNQCKNRRHKSKKRFVRQTWVSILWLPIISFIANNKFHSHLILGMQLVFYGMSKMVWFIFFYIFILRLQIKKNNQIKDKSNIANNLLFVCLFCIMSMNLVFHL